MVVKDKKIEKVYSSYVSEYHLEMILVPFINSKIEEKEKRFIKLGLIEEKKFESKENEGTTVTVELKGGRA